MDKAKFLEAISGGLIVSCQALPGEPFYTDEGGLMSYFALAAKMLELLAYVQIPFEILRKSKRKFLYRLLA